VDGGFLIFRRPTSHMKYNFEIHFERYQQTSCLNDVRAIYVSGICIAAKNQKFGKPYISKYVKNVLGAFLFVAGSERYPTLYPKNKAVVLTLEGFPHYPVLNVTEHQTHITIKNVCEY
jgi:hypothetical protein